MASKGDTQGLLGSMIPRLADGGITFQVWEATWLRKGGATGEDYKRKETERDNITHVRYYRGGTLAQMRCGAALVTLKVVGPNEENLHFQLQCGDRIESLDSIDSALKMMRSFGVE